MKLNHQQDNEGADPITFDEPVQTVDDFAVCHDEVELVEQELAHAAYTEFEPRASITVTTEPTDQQLQELEAA